MPNHSLNVSLRQLRAIISIARNKSFSRAAAELDMSQSALSQAVQQLELLVGVKLLDRSTRDVRLSRIGEETLPSIERAVEVLDRELNGLQDLRQLRRGRITIACLPSIALQLLPEVLSSFEEISPEIDVSIREMPLERIRRAMLNGQADIGIANLSPDDPELHTTLLTTDRFALVLRRDHPLASGASVTWREATQVKMVAMSEATGIGSEIKKGLQGHSITMATHYQVEHPATILALVEAGLGVAPLPGHAWPKPNHPTLTCRPLVEPVLERNLHLIWKADRDLSPAAKAFSTHIGNVVQAAAPE